LPSRVSFPNCPDPADPVACVLSRAVELDCDGHRRGDGRRVGDRLVRVCELAIYPCDGATCASRCGEDAIRTRALPALQLDETVPVGDELFYKPCNHRDAVT